MLPILLSLVLLIGCSKTYPVKVTWDAPTNGAQVDHYVVEVHKESNIKTYETSETFLYAVFIYEKKYFVKVLGVGSSGEYGPFSENSNVMFVISP